MKSSPTERAQSGGSVKPIPGKSSGGVVAKAQGDQSQRAPKMSDMSATKKKVR